MIPGSSIPMFVNLISGLKKFYLKKKKKNIKLTNNKMFVFKETLNF